MSSVQNCIVIVKEIESRLGCEFLVLSWEYNCSVCILYVILTEFILLADKRVQMEIAASIM